MYDIEIAPGGLDELKQIKPFARKAILDSIEKHLTHQPLVVTRNRKPLPDLSHGFDTALDVVWELRVGEHRVLYDVDVQTKRVKVLAVRHKPPDQTTEQILEEDEDEDDQRT